jgi:hypothetical protein
VLERTPRELSVQLRGDGLELTWPAGSDASAVWHVERAAIDGRHPARKTFETLAETTATRFMDEDMERELLYEYRVTRLGETFGSRARAVRGAWRSGPKVPVLRGTELSLLTGDVDGSRVDIVVDYVSGDAIQLSPGTGRSLRLLSPEEAAQWELPEPGDQGYQAPRTMTQVGRSLAVLLPEGILARITVERGDEETPRLRCQIDLDGGRTFPQPPAEPAVRWTPEGIRFDFTAGAGRPSPAVLKARSKVKPSLVLPPELPDNATLVIEREDEFGTGTFVEVLESGPGDKDALDPVGGPPRIVRYRFRSRGANGLTSPASEPKRVLLIDDGNDTEVEGLVASAVRDLGEADYKKRDSARAVLELLEGRALDALSRALLSEDPEVAGSARELLSRISPQPGGGGTAVSAALVLRARAVAEGFEAEPPIEGLFDDSPVARAMALLRQAGREGAAPSAGSELERWRALVAEADPDTGVRLVAQLWHSLGAEPVRPAMRQLYGRNEPDPIEGAAADVFAAARESLHGARTVAEVTDVVARVLPGLDPWQELLALGVVAELEAQTESPASLVSAESLERMQLALALLEHNARTDDAIFLDAADRLFEDPAGLVVAWREFARRRFEREEDASERRVEHLSVAEGSALDVLLSELEQEEAQDLDLILPAGVYERTDEASRRPISISGLRLIAEGDVVLRGTLTFMNAEDVVLQGLAIEGRNRTSLMVTSGSVFAQDCVLSGNNTCISGLDALVGLSNCELLSNTERAAVTGVRLSGASLLLARDTAFDCNGSALQGTRSALFERCVIDSGRRNGIDGTRGGALVLVDCLIESDASCLSNIERGVLDGVVLLSPGRAVAAFRQDVALCSEHLIVPGGEGELDHGQRLDECPLERTRFR